MDVADVEACSFSNWYEGFRDVTIRSVCIRLSPDFVDYLREDGLFLPRGVETSSSSIANRRNSSSSSSSWSSSDSEDSDPQSQHSFPDLHLLVTSAISDLGGSVFAKLNWSSPKDASWIGLNRSLKCGNFGDVILLLKASDFVQHDLTRPYEFCSGSNEELSALQDYDLVLKRWTDVNPASEYRCFVKDGKLVGVSQRDMTTHYRHLSEEKGAILAAISRFFEDKIKRNFPRPNYVFDVFLTENPRTVRLLDFNPFGSTTDSLLFTWEELNNNAFGASNGIEFVPDFRYVLSGQGMRPQEYSQYQLPVDMVDLMTGTDPDKLVDFLRLRGAPNGGVSSDEEDVSN